MQRGQHKNHSPQAATPAHAGLDGDDAPLLAPEGWEKEEMEEEVNGLLRSGPGELGSSHMECHHTTPLLGHELCNPVLTGIKIANFEAHPFRFGTLSRCRYSSVQLEACCVFLMLWCACTRMSHPMFRYAQNVQMYLLKTSVLKVFILFLLSRKL